MNNADLAEKVAEAHGDSDGERSLRGGPLRPPARRESRRSRERRCVRRHGVLIPLGFEAGAAYGVIEAMGVDNKAALKVAAQYGAEPGYPLTLAA